MARSTREPTVMGARILAFLSANGIRNQAQFAEGVLGISKQRFYKWIYSPSRDVEARPLLRCAEVLGTNPYYLLGDSDDPRPGMALEMREYQLVESFRAMTEKDQDRLLATATAWVAENPEAPTTSDPFRVPVKR